MIATASTRSEPIRVLVVDDSPAAQRLLCRELEKHAGIEVVGTAPDPYVAREQIVSLQPDVLTLDVRMPRMDGITFLRRLMKHHPMPVIVISAMSAAGGEIAIEALAAGAVDFVCKPSAGGIDKFSDALAEKIYAASKARVHSSSAPAGPQLTMNLKYSDAIFALGASTGGVQAITEIVSALPEDMPPILVVQHMPAGFTASFAKRLDVSSRISVKEAEDGVELVHGRVLIAPGGKHMIVQRVANKLIAAITDGPDYCHQKPSIGVMFDSVAQHVGPRAVGVLLTGMGADGAEGLLNLRRAGAHTIAQDEETCTVFGMPAEAIRIAAAQSVLPLGRISQAMISLASSKRACA